MMTTDTVHKLAARTLDLDRGPVQITAMAKGAAMIGPNMATMLGLVLTDAVLTPATAQAALADAVAESFNCISVEGHMSTNDTVLLLAGGAAGGQPLAGESWRQFQAALSEVCIDSARAIIADGEGATHLITIDVEGAASRDDARKIAKTVAESPLVKTAITGADPNWGRIVSAVGYTGVPVDPADIELSINGHRLFQHGEPVPSDPATVSASIRERRDTHIALRVGTGNAGVRFWTTDLTAEYIRLNADYHT
jgi:glutamate N-acetyltransferase/amino-acid N-acetyltransferase